MHPLLPALVASVFVVLLVGALVRRFNQPHAIAYLIVGVVLGPSGLDLFEEHSVALVGELGVILLLFFVGMEVDLAGLASRWRVSVSGTLLQAAASVGAVGLVGLWLDWPLARVVLLGFAISLSSTALVVTMLRQWRELDTEDGHEAMGILLIQDVAIVPMLIVVGLLGGGNAPSASAIAVQLVSGVVVVAFVVALVRGARFRLPFGASLRRDRELQVFGAFLVCFAFAWVTGVVGLSTALGAFVAGLAVSAAHETAWVRRSLEPFRVILVAAFFVSVGMLIEVRFLAEHWRPATALVVFALLTNTLINAGILRAAGRSWSSSVYVGALLSQIGEFSFVLAAIGREVGIISDFGYQMVLGVVAGTLVVGPAWIALFRRFRGPTASVPQSPPRAPRDARSAT